MALRSRSIWWKILAGILNKLSVSIIPIFLRPNFWVIAKKSIDKQLLKIKKDFHEY